MQNIHKNFDMNEVLCGVDYHLKCGEIHALMGENGAGKSTLMNILTGECRADKGTIWVNEHEVYYENPQAAEDAGITFIHQELNICPNLTILQNLFIGKEQYNFFGFLNNKIMRQMAITKCAEIGIELPLDELAGSCSIGQQQMAEIVKALMTAAKVIIMDEPTAALTERETSKLFMVMQQLKQRQVSIIYISHRMEEVFSHCDRITVMRDGITVSTKNIADSSFVDVVREMVGRDINARFPERKQVIGNEVLRVENLTCTGKFKQINFKVCAGEILGIAGLMGSGRSEIMRTIFGLDGYNSGQIFLNKEKIKINSPVEAIKHCIGFISENRRDEGLILDFSINDNISLPKIDSFTLGGLIRKVKENEFVLNLAKYLNIKMSSTAAPVKQLSGGNQQKVVIAKWVGIKPKILIMDEPTRGVDVMAKYEIYELMNKLTAEGVAIIMVSSELTEILGMSDRMIVIHEGDVAGELTKAEATQEKIMHLATGGQ